MSKIPKDSEIIPSGLLPICTKCGSLTQIRINPNNFAVSFQCMFNNHHDKNNIPYKEFCKKYLRSIESLKNESIFLEKNKSITDEKKILLNNLKKSNLIKTVDNYNSIEKCQEHSDYYVDEYCTECKKNICVLCNRNKEHSKHKREHYSDILISDEDITNINSLYEQRCLFINDLINCIQKWTEELIDKTKVIINKLDEEKMFIKKMISNINYKYFNFIYIDNLNYMRYFLKNNIINENLTNFKKSTKFEEKTKNMNKVFMDLNICKEITIKEENTISNYNKVKKLNDKCYLGHYRLESLMRRRLSINFYENNTNYYLENSIFEFDEQIYSITPSIYDNKIFICLKNKKIIVILKYDLTNVSITHYKEINRNNTNNIIQRNLFANNTVIRYYKKCIEFKKDELLTLDSTNIITKWNNYNEIKEKNIEKNIFNFILINNKLFICAIPAEKILIIYDIDTMDEVKQINNIDCENLNDCLIKFRNKFILVNCRNGIGMIFINTLEMCQYIEYPNKNRGEIILRNSIFCDYENLYYYVPTERKIYVLKYNKKEFREVFIINLLGMEGEAELTVLNQNQIFLKNNNDYLKVFLFRINF